MYFYEYESFSDVLERIPYFIEDVYNRKKLHSTLVYLPPEKYDKLLAKNDSQESEIAKTLIV